MKNKITKSLALIFSICLFLTGCGSSNYETINNGIASDMVCGNIGYDKNIEYEYTTAEDEYESSTTEPSTTEIYDISRKLIKRYTYSFKTTEFDKSYQNIITSLNECGGYMEESSMNSSGNRYFEATLRIPEENIDKFLSNTDSYGKVYDTYMTTEDVTLNYVDTESRISSLKIEYERIENLLLQADTIESIIQLEERLEEIRYELENYGSIIRTYDNLISYVTLNLTLREVPVEIATQNDNVFIRMWTEFLNSISDILHGSQELLILFVGLIPYIIIFGLIGFIIFKIYKKRKSKKILKTNSNLENNESLESKNK